MEREDDEGTTGESGQELSVGQNDSVRKEAGAATHGSGATGIGTRSNSLKRLVRPGVKNEAPERIKYLRLR